MKILYVASRYSPLDCNAGSGVDYELYKALSEQSAELSIVGPFDDKPSLAERGYRKIHSLISQNRYAKYSSNFLSHSSEITMMAINEHAPDVIFSIFAAPLVRLQTRIPIVFMIDTTLIGSQEQWPIFSRLEYSRMLRWERSVLKKSSSVYTCSEWSARILNERYHLPKEKVGVFPMPASLPSSSIPSELNLQHESLTPLRLLLVGRDYERKGIDIAIEVVKQLNQSGVMAELRIVGLEGQDQPHVKFTRLYNKTISSDLEEYIGHYQWAHFLIHPARFEAAGIVPSEAAAFGVPTITNAAGGLATTVLDQVSGIVLPRGSIPQAYVNSLLYYINQPSAYIELRRTSRQRYERELNWQVTGKRLYEELQNLLRRQP